MSDLNLEETITSAIEDAVTTPEPVETPETQEAAQTPTEPVEAAPETAEAPTEAVSAEIPSPATKVEAPAAVKEDEFSKKFGIPAESQPGRENRIPYSRVKKITEKAIKEREDAILKEYTPKLTALETENQEHKARLTQVAEFEHIMLNDGEKFLQMLSTIPMYAPVFKALEAYVAGQGQVNDPAQSQQVVSQEDPMPEPDQALEDGTKVYSMDGLKALLAWQSKQTESRVTKQVEDRYKPIESAWQSEQYLKQVYPQVKAQIDEARKWPLFNDNEAEITKELQANQKLSLEGAYQKVVWPKLVADRNKIREEVLAEIKKAPVSTAAPARAARPASLTQSGGPKTLEQIVAEAAGITLTADN